MLAGLADSLFYYSTTSLFLPIFNVGYGVDAILLGLTIGVPRQRAAAGV